MTGTSAAPAKAPADEESEWSIEELKAGKPLMAYYFIDGLTNASGDDNYEFSRRVEIGCWGNSKVIEKINADWKCRKGPIDVDADRKLAKNQARIEFWSFTGVKMGDIDLKEQSLLNPGPFKAALLKYEAKNKEICLKEIKRIEAAKKAEEKAAKQDEKSAAK